MVSESRQTSLIMKFPSKSSGVLPLPDGSEAAVGGPASAQTAAGSHFRGICTDHQTQTEQSAAEKTPPSIAMQWEGSFPLHHNTRHWHRPPTTGGSSVEGERQTLGTRLLTEKTACFKPCKSACSPKKLPARNRLISGPAAFCVREREGKVSLLPFPRRALRCALRGRACPTAPLR